MIRIMHISGNVAASCDQDSVPNSLIPGTGQRVPHPGAAFKVANKLVP